MGFLDKIKNLFTEEIEEEIPVKKETIKVEISPPKVEEPENKIEISDTNLNNKDERSSFPVFDDSDFDDLLKPREERTNVIYGGNKEPKQEEKPPFKLSPIISPVYGILDKNYTKEDITTKNVPKPQESKSSNNITIDDIRKKAYGTLEEDLETELFSHNSILFKEYEEEEEEVDDLFLELEENTFDNAEHNNDRQATNDNSETRLSIEEEIIEISRFNSSSEEKITETRSERNMVAEELEKIFEEDEPLSEGDLFNLIDSMYEKGEDD